jgi:peptidoglycan/LPS O-acetylase OafA/YrhL
LTDKTESRAADTSAADRAAPAGATTTAADNFRPDVEGLRGVAVLMVVLYHAALLSGSSVQIPGGFLGVDLFFVISGFLITGLLVRERERSGTISFLRFYARRVRRILPAAVATLLIVLPLAYILVPLESRSDALTDGASAALSIANIRYAMTTDYFNPTQYSPFLHFWSLGVEEQFYLVWPAILLAVAWRRPRAGIVAALAAIAVVSFAVNVAITDSNPAFSFYMLPTRAWQLAAGGLLALWTGAPARVDARLRTAYSRALTGLGWVALGVLAFDALTLNSSVVAYPGVAALGPTVAAVFLIASGTAKWGPGVLLRVPPLRFVGKISYSLYLWHWPILLLGGAALNGADALSPTMLGAPQVLEPVQALALAAFAVPVAWASWAFVEEPFRRGRISLPSPGRLVTAGVGAMLAVALVATCLSIGAQNTLASLDAPVPAGSAVAQVTNPATASPTPGLTPTSASTPGLTPASASTGASASPPSIAPGASASGPSIAPGWTPAITPAPSPTAPSSYSVVGLRPSVGAAPHDFEAAIGSGCLYDVRAVTPPSAGRCVFANRSGSYTVALIGDSHASALFPAVDAVAAAHGWRLLVYTKMSCPFVDMPIGQYGGGEYGACETWNARVLADIQGSGVNLALVTMRRDIINPDGSLIDARVLGRALARETDKLPATTTRVLVEDFLYPWNENVPQCLSNHPSDYRRCAYSRSTGRNDQWSVRETTAVAASTTGLQMIDTEDWTCPGSGSCPVVISGMIVFRDTHHLTATYCLSLAPALDSALAAILNQKDDS